MKAKKNRLTEYKPKLLLYFTDVRLLCQAGINFSKHLLLISILTLLQNHNNHTLKEQCYTLGVRKLQPTYQIFSSPSC